MEHQQLTLRERQLEYLRILKELDRYCTQKGLRYYIGCGTLIGAVRHKGFIPWDDDLDVFMPEPDFNTFAKEYKSNDFQIQSCWNSLAHQHIFARFCSNSIGCIPSGMYQEDFGIDVYIIYGAPSEMKKREEHINNVFKLIKRRDRIRRIRNGLARRCLWPIKNLECRLLNKSIKRIIMEFRKYDFSNSEYIWPFGGGKLLLKKELYGTPVRLPFEDGFFLAPEHYHEVLTMGYGDYMELPPVEKRKPYHGSDYYHK